MSLILGTNAGFGQTHPPATLTPTVVADKASQIKFIYSLNPDCSNADEADTRITKNPQHGKVEITPGEGFPNFPESDIRHACNTKKVPGHRVMYTPEAGYTGKDTMQMEFIYPLGGDWFENYSISVK
jgi:hypothetical protein